MAGREIIPEKFPEMPMICIIAGFSRPCRGRVNLPLMTQKPPEYFRLVKAVERLFLHHIRSFTNNITVMPGIYSLSDSRYTAYIERTVPYNIS